MANYDFYQDIQASNYTRTKTWQSLNDVERTQFCIIYNANDFYKRIIGMLQPVLANAPIGYSVTLDSQYYYDNYDGIGKTKAELTNNSFHRVINKEKNQIDHIYPVKTIKVELIIGSDKNIIMSFTTTPKYTTTINNNASVQFRVPSGCGSGSLHSISDSQWECFGKTIESILPELTRLVNN